MYINNYKELCSILEIEYKGGTYKKARIKELARYCRYENRGHKFLINQIYDEPLQEEDGRSRGNNSKYIQLIEVILCNYLYLNKREATFTQLQWLKNLGMVNDLYGNEDTMIKLSANYNSYNLHEFMNKSREILGNIFFNALGNMKRHNVIDYNEEIVITDCYNESFIADDEQVQIIEGVEKEIIDLMELSGKREVFFRKRENEFYSRVYNVLTNQYKWSYYFKKYKIWLLDYENNIRESDNYIISVKNELNKKIVDAINLNIEMRYSKSDEWKEIYDSDNTWIYLLEYIEKTGEEGLPIPKKPFKYHEDYNDIQKQLTNELINTNLTI